MLKKMAITAACSVGCCLLVTLWIVPSIYQARVAAAPVPSSNTSVSAVSSAYRVAAYNGFVAAFDGDSEQPFLILDTPIRALPESDQLQLEKGIPLHSIAELQALLEDYS